MVKYKVQISIDGENFFWTIVENGKIINRNATREALVKITTKMYYYNKTNICDTCREENEKEGKALTDDSVLYPGNALRKWDRWVCMRCYKLLHTYGTLDNDKIKNNKTKYLIKKDETKGKNQCCVCNKLIRCLRKEYKEEKHTGGWICEKCRGEEYYINMIKPMTDHRIGNLDPNSSAAKGDNFEELTSIWKRVKILSKENDKYCGPLDHSIDSNGKRPETKGKFYDPYNRRWLQDCRSPQNTIRRGFLFDYLILYCASKDGKDIDRIYEFPIEELMNRSCVNIIKNPMNHCGTVPITPWYEKYRIIDEEELRKVNKIWKKIIKE